MQQTWKQSPQTVSIPHTFIHKKPCNQKLHAAIGGSRPSTCPLDPPLFIVNTYDYDSLLAVIIIKIINNNNNNKSANL